MAELTEREKRVYDYIREVIGKDGYSPSVRDIKHALGIKSTSTVQASVEALAEKGYIRKENGKSRTLRTDNFRLCRVPLLGRVAAGLPIFASESDDGSIAFPVQDGENRSLFALNVRGESMTGVGIMDGDTVIVAKQDYAEDGDIVVALIGDEATVKTLRRENGLVWLRPENPKMSMIYAKEMRILGKVISCLRYY